MRKSRYTDSQILSTLKQNEAGELVTDLCREHGMSNATFYARRRTLLAGRNERPHTAIGGIPPRQFLNAA